MLTADDRRRTASDVRLYTFPGSHAGLIAELMLAHKGMTYETVVTPRGRHVYLLPAYGFRRITVPALTIAGRRLQRTRVISRALDMWQPEPRLFPSDPRRRAAVERAERWGEDLQDAVRRLSYCATRRACPSTLATLGSIRHRASAEAGRRDAAALPGCLAQIDAWIEAGVLGGDELNAADFQVAPSVAVLLSFADFAPHIAGRPAAEHALRVAGRHERSRGPALPDEWLRPLRSARA